MSGPGKPVFTGKRPVYTSLLLLPVSKIVKPVAVKVWVCKAKQGNESGWSGWLESQRRPGLTAVLPSFWPASSWQETTEKQAQLALKAFEKTKPGAIVTATPPARLTGKDIREAAKAAGKAERAAKPGPVKAAPKSEPEPTPPTGTDGPSKAVEQSDAATVAGAIETAIGTLGTVAQSLRRLDAESRGVARTVATVKPVVKTGSAKNKPGLRKAMPATAPTVKRRKAR